MVVKTTHKNSLNSGYQLHWYKIIDILGQGAFGITYLARDLNLDRDVAIKEYMPIDMSVREGDDSIHPVSDDHGKEFGWGLERFISEARTLAKFDHENIVRVYSVFEENNTGYMVMRYEEGQSLKDKITKESTIPESEILDIIMPILNGLEIIHKHGFIHRDIKPDNIYIRADGSPVLIDFGSARQALGDKTRTLTSVLTPGYAPIEQYYSKSDEQGPWTDIYSLGATVYRAITGISLLDAIDRSKGILEVSKDSYVSTVELCEGKYSVEFLRAIDHSLQFHRNSRPHTIQEWRHEFGFYTDKVTEEGRDEAEFIVTQLAEKNAIDFDLTGDFEQVNNEKTHVIKENVQDSSGKRIKPVLVFVILLISVCGFAFLYPEQIINSVGSLIFAGPDSQDFEQKAATELNQSNMAGQPAMVTNPISERNDIIATAVDDESKEFGIELERERLAAEREDINRERQQLEEARRKQEQEQLLEENKLLQERLAMAELEMKREQEARERQEEIKRLAEEKETERLAEQEEARKIAELESNKKESYSFAVFLERLVFPDVNTLYRGVLNVCEFYSEDDPGACIATINSCKDFAQDDQGLFKFCASEYVNKLIALSTGVSE